MAQPHSQQHAAENTSGADEGDGQRIHLWREFIFWPVRCRAMVRFLPLDSQPSTLNHLPQMSELPAKENSTKHSRSHRPLHIGLRHFSAREFLIVLVAMFVALPFMENLAFGDAIDSILIMLVLVSGVLAVGGRRRTLAIALALAIPAVVGKWA